MRVSEKMRKALSILLCICMLVQNCPVVAFAAGEDNLCEHHPEHTAECHYAEAVAGVECAHECGEECAEGCVHTSHDDLCGYIEAVEGHDCHYECVECANSESSVGDGSSVPGTTADDGGMGNPSPTDAPVCDCGTDDPAIHAVTCGMYVAPENPQCYCAEKCTEANVWCDVCGFDYTQCTGTDRAVGYDTGWEIEESALIVTGTLTVLPDMEYSSIKVYEGGNLNLGTTEVTCDVYNNYGGTISGGTFTGYVYNYGTITNVTFWYATVSNSEDGTISNAKFEKNAKLAEGSTPPQSVIHSVNGEDVALTYNAALPAALGEAEAWYQGDTQVTDGTVPLNYTTYVGEYAVNTAAATNGTVSVPATAKFGQTVTVTATASEGYVLDTLTVQQGEAAVTVTDNAFTMPAGAVTVTAIFKAICTCESKCAEGSVNDECAVCGVDYSKCTGTECGEVGYTYDAATNTYTVYTADGLFAVAELAYNEDSSINITLAADIVLNENLADKVNVAEDGTVSVDASVRKWTPLGGGAGGGQYSGTFDGGNHTITGLYCFESENDTYSGLIEWLAPEGTVKNLKIRDFCLERSYSGAIAGQNEGKIIGCSISGTGIFNGSPELYGGQFGGIVCENVGQVTDCSISANLFLKGAGQFGGIAHYNAQDASITGCSNSGTLTGTDSVGGIVSSNNGTVTGCYNTGTVNAMADYAYIHVGGIVSSNNGTVTGCYNTGNISCKAMAEFFDAYVGGIAGLVDGTVSGCYNTGNISGDAAADRAHIYVGGIAGYADSGTVSGCYNTAAVSGDATGDNSYARVGGIVGLTSGTVSGCYNIGSVDSGTYSGGIAACAYGTFADCYYLDTCVKSGSPERSSSEGITEKTSDQFASGEVAYLLNGDQSTITFKQTLGENGDAYPSFTGGTVYQVKNCKEENDYSNTNENIGHQWVNGTCTVCDLVCGHSGGTTKPTDNGNGTHSSTCAVCGNTVTEEHTMNGTTGKCVCGAELAVASVTVGGTTTYFGTLNEAIQAVSSCSAGDNAEVKLLKDINQGNSYQTISSGVFTLDLNGKSLEGQDIGLQIIDANVTITDSKGGGTISGGGRGVYADSSTVKISGGTVSGSSNGVYAVNNGTVEIIAGTVSGSDVNGSGCGVFAYDNCTVKVLGGEVSGSGCGVSAYENSPVTISSGAVSGSYGVQTYWNSTVTILGGTVSGDYNEGVYAYESSVTISGGTVSGGTVSGDYNGVYA